MNKPLIIIFFISIILRLIFINQYPPSPNWDEVSLGYNSYSILKTGKDEWGNFLPLLFRAYGDYKLPSYVYFSVPFIAIFGLNSLSIKLVSIISGSLLGIVFYFTLKKIFTKNNYLSYIGSIILSLSPWSIFLSRIALEANLFLLLFSISIYFLIDKKYVLSSIFYGLCLFTYNSSRIYLIFYLLLLTILFIKEKYLLIKHLPKYSFFLVTIIILIYQNLSSTGLARYQWVSLIDQGAINQINELRNKYPRIIANKVTYFTFKATQNYLSHFNPQYLFFNGGSNYQFSIPNTELINPLFIPLLLIGLIYLIFYYKDHRLKFILLFWLLMAPIPSAITRDAPHVLRGITLFPVITIIIIFGLDYLKSIPKKISFIYIFIALLVTQISFWRNYRNYSLTYSSSWQYGYQQLVEYIKPIYSNYDQIIITKKYGEPHEFILFYWPIPPSDYQSDKSKKWDYHSNWYWIDSFGKFKFINDWEMEQNIGNLSKKTLIITSQENYNNSYHLLKKINFLNNSTAFQIYEN
jgi:4-amino-4-deoxy-L-arabinose transferase-like glycosyltransferase